MKVQVRVQKGIKRINSLIFHLSFNIKHSAQRAAGVGIVRVKVRVSERRGSFPALFLLITNYKLRITAHRVKVRVSVGGRKISRSRGRSRGKKNQ
ncbi:MAG: hypothetical protein DRJ08_05205 [Acidobacteria bacterium]|nr:MAG: hypothetical protein DRJ08_05205 [Acidobacteriota bacterium]